MYWLFALYDYDIYLEWVLYMIVLDPETITKVQVVGFSFWKSGLFQRRSPLRWHLAGACPPLCLPSGRCSPWCPWGRWGPGCRPLIGGSTSGAEDLVVLSTRNPCRPWHTRWLAHRHNWQWLGLAVVAVRSLLVTLLAAVSLSHRLHLHAGSIEAATSSPAIFCCRWNRTTVYYLKHNIGLQEFKQWPMGSNQASDSLLVKATGRKDMDRSIISTGSNRSSS
jgi:hypothetical protein